jgi:hypothetical protein
MLAESEMSKLETACLRLPSSNVQVQESHIYGSPILILMSTILSLNRKWYIHALPARQRFEENIYPSMKPNTLERFREILDELSIKRSDWSQLSQGLWKTNEREKARMLSELVDYLIDWREKNAPKLGDLEFLRKWALTIPKAQFIGKIKGLGPRAHEQLLWYLEGNMAIKLDRHITNFVNNIVGFSIPEEEKILTLREIAKRIGISATMLDSRIWDYMQSKKNR